MLAEGQMPEGKLLRVIEVAERLGLRETTVRSWLADGRLPRVKIGSKAIRVPQEAVERIIREGSEEVPVSASP